MHTYPLNNIEDALSGSGEVRPDGYSGRGMYGKTCAAVTFDDISESFRFFALLGSFATSHDDAEMDPAHPSTKLMLDLVDAARTDSMGRGVIVYFPGWTFA